MGRHFLSSAEKNGDLDLFKAAEKSNVRHGDSPLNDGFFSLPSSGSHYSYKLDYSLVFLRNS